MRQRIAAVIATALITLLVTASSATAADTVIATLTQGTKIDAFGGHVIWSERDAGSGRWHLVDFHDGQQRRLAVSDSSATFDVDLGRDQRGRLVAVYGRCRRPHEEHTFGRAGCDVYRYDFETTRETKISEVSTDGADEVQPTLWGSRIAFVRETLTRKRNGFDARRVAYTRVLRPGGRIRPLKGPKSAFLSAMDVRSGAIAIHLSHSFHDLVRVMKPGRRNRILFATPDHRNASQVYATMPPKFGDEHTVYWGLGSWDPNWLELWRRDLRDGPAERATTRIPGTAALFAQDGDVSYYATDDDPDDDSSPLQLHRLDGLQFERAPRLTLDPDG